jgi:hypothetical protein
MAVSIDTAHSARKNHLGFVGHAAGMITNA